MKPLIGDEGYVQLIDSTGKILAQVKSYEANIPIFKERVWNVINGHSVIFTRETDVIHPDKFMNPLDELAKIYIYDFEDSIDAPNEPDRSFSVTTIIAQDLEDVCVSDVVNLTSWNAFCDGMWVGTSEY